MIIFLPVTAISSYFSRIFYCLHIKKFFSSRFTSLNYYFTSYWNRFGASSTKKNRGGGWIQKKKKMIHHVRNDIKWWELNICQTHTHFTIRFHLYVFSYESIFFFGVVLPTHFFCCTSSLFLNKSYHITLCLLCHTLTHTHIELGGAGAPNSY